MFRAALAVLLLTVCRVSAEPPPDPVGVWEGALTVGGAKLRLGFKIEKKADGSLAAKMDSPDQGATGIPLDDVKLDGRSLTLAFKQGGASFAGELSEDSKSLKGDWKQSGQSFQLAMKRVDKVTELRRPQHPVKPYPYHEEDVEITNADVNITLAGTFTKPKEGGPFPAVVLVSGSGPQDRDESILGHKPFLVIADHFAKKGIAVLRFDDRGVGKSKGDHAKATTADFATDAYSAVQFLKSRKDVDAKRIGIAGHSEGGLIGPLVAATHPDDVGFLILLSGPGLPGDWVLADQLEAILRASGGKDHDIGLQKGLQQAILKAAKTGGSKDEIKSKSVAAAKEYLKSLSEADRKIIDPDGKEDHDGIARISSPWMLFFMNHDPRPILKKVRCPVLALNGEKDLQVTPKENLAAVGAALKEGGNDRVTLMELPGLNHLFQTSKSGMPTEYATIEETFAPAVLETMATWILKQK